MIAAWRAPAASGRFTMATIWQFRLPLPMTTFDPALEREYNNRALVPEHPAIFEKWRTDSAAFRACADAELDIAFGDDALQRLDLFPAKNARGTVVFIHGGYWRSLDKSDFSFVAALFVANGISVAMINYRLCPTVAVADVVDDCQSACMWLIDNGPAHHMPVERIALTGHSAGGHLVSMLFATDWHARGIDAKCIVGGAALSGVFDLAPLLRCSMNDDLGLDTASARALSPIQLVSQIDAPLYLAAGGDESAAFIEQTRQLHRAWPANCAVAEIVASRNHFTIVGELARTECKAFHVVRKLFD